MRLFDYLRFIFDTSDALLSGDGKSVVVWMRNNTSWSCGACFNAVPQAIHSFDFDSAIWIPATAQDQSFWSDAVTSHEFGHWAMASFGVEPREGGRHCVGSKSPPGMAWSEGFATWFSSAIRSDSVYYDKQGGTMFHLDLDLRTYSSGVPWQRPVPSEGLLQTMDENEVAATILTLSTSEGMPTVLSALESPRMTTTPFGRGYTGTLPWEVDGNCNPIDPQPSDFTAPCMADMLDALRCDGVQAASIDAATEPSTHYPYPSNSPICN